MLEEFLTEEGGVGGGREIFINSIKSGSILLFLKKLIRKLPEASWI